MITLGILARYYCASIPPNPIQSRQISLKSVLVLVSCFVSFGFALSIAHNTYRFRCRTLKRFNHLLDFLC